MATVTDVKLHIEDHGGDGDPVILIHGWPLSGEAWENQITAMTGAGLRVITYDRRGFGRSDKPDSGYDYDTLSDDLAKIIEMLGLTNVSLVGFSMGGGEVARYVGRHGTDRLKKVVFASAVPPFMMKTDDNPDGPLTEDAAAEMESSLRENRDLFFEKFTSDFFTADGDIKVSRDDRQAALLLCKESDQTAALACMGSFGTTDFRDDLKKVDVPTLVIHGDADGIVPLEGSGQRTADMIDGAELHMIKGAPHGANVSHADEFNKAVIAFLNA
ncbi:alpha/beta fold hydrolase [Pseudooceanicola sp. MF1-13]|uniref:alpha/beta fold hydrolase n=1 Tax=Pseudooceanicola sp. MF1-13 TaxID=3379095 RepID=UPI003891943A